MKLPVIAVVGSLNMDLVVSVHRLPRIGETMAGTSIDYIPGGKGANQAVGAARLGADVSMIGAVGGDDFGSRIINSMEGFGVNISAIAVNPEAPTGTATILRTKEDNSIVIVAGANGTCTPESIEANASAIQNADIVLVQLEIPIPAVEAALRIAKASGVPTVLNPAPACALSDELIGLADYFTPNETEFEFFSGYASASESELFKRMHEWHERYGHTLIVTRGEAGVSCLSAGVLTTVPATLVTPIDTTGAGDAFNAAFSFGIASGWEISRSLTFAVKSATLSVQKFGAQDGMPTIEEVGYA